MWILQTKATEHGGDPMTFRVRAGAMKTMGRATRADFIVDEALVSRLHCRFTVGAAGELEVEDLDSTNGTFVNGKRVKRVRLVHGDLVRVGQVEIEVAEAPN
jgi:pSer/pThr/pTyr-binding forkhead associated (FHA) protein